MRKSERQDKIVRDLLSKVEPTSAPPGLKKQILDEIETLSIDSVTKTVVDKQRYLHIWIPVAVIVIFCLGWTLAQVEWSGWTIALTDWIRVPEIDWNLSSRLSSISLQIPSFSYTSNNWLIYLVGSIIIAWIYFIGSIIIRKFSKANQAFSA